ncbi:MAG: hypothetical protein OQK11_02275 [Thiovulaceae bacterium]|nr:hypothetical protein [Sulfurimonadaceae bacterium]
MVNVKKISHQILDDGLYNTILFEMCEELDKKNPTPSEIENLLTSNTSYIKEYKEINRHSEISSIQIKTLLSKAEDSTDAKDNKKLINENIQQLKNLENFEVDSSNSAYSIWIGSVGVMILFMAHNVIALFSELYTTHSMMVYGLYSIVLALTYIVYKKIKQNHEQQHLRYQKLYSNTKEQIQKGLEKDYFTYKELYMK